MTAETNPSTLKAKRRSAPRFWVGPLVAGVCFALGYGITQRIVMIRAGLQQPERQTFFADRSFPGDSLEALRLRHGETNALAADVAAKEVIDAKTLKQSKEVKEAKLAKELEQRKAKEEAERIAAAAIARERRQQAAATTPRRVEDIPALNEAAVFETTAPAELLDPQLPFSEPSLLPSDAPELPQTTLSEPSSMPTQDPELPQPRTDAPEPMQAIVEPGFVEPVLEERELLITPIGEPPAP
ncbi:MAG: hypothetical protein CMK50_06295 [Propionibacteriaceae bacterium]|nr:hypothetical protein [Propionibacteriaceae bacterium]